MQKNLLKKLPHVYYEENNVHAFIIETIADFDTDTYESGSGLIEYGPLDSLGRPTGVEAYITPDMINTGTKANQGIRPPGFVSETH